MLLVVTHGANIQALTGISPAPGEIVVVKRADQFSPSAASRRLAEEQKSSTRIARFGLV